MLLSALLLTASNGQPNDKLLFGNDMSTCSLDENSLDFINCIANVYVYSVYHPIVSDHTIKQIFSPSNKLMNDLTCLSLTLKYRMVVVI